MRKQILKLLRSIEEQNTFKNINHTIYEFDAENSTYEEFLEYQQNKNQEHLLKFDYEKHSEDKGYSSVRSFLHFPNYRFLINEFNIEYKKGIQIPQPYITRLLIAELKRMEADKLIMISTQEILEYIFETNGDFSINLIGRGWKSNTECITLTTKGKSYYKYVLENAFENPIPTVISIISLVISIVPIIIKYYM